MVNDAQKFAEELAGMDLKPQHPDPTSHTGVKARNEWEMTG